MDMKDNSDEDGQCLSRAQDQHATILAQLPRTKCHAPAKTSRSPNCMRVCMRGAPLNIPPRARARCSPRTRELGLDALDDAGHGLVELFLLGQDGDVVAHHAVHQVIAHRLPRICQVYCSNPSALLHGNNTCSG